MKGNVQQVHVGKMFPISIDAFQAWAVKHAFRSLVAVLGRLVDG